METFLEECGAAGPLTIEIEEPGRVGTRHWQLDQPFAVIGRDERVDVQLDHDLVSRRHTYLQVIDGRVFYVDLDSRAGTIAEKSSPQAGWLAPGQTLMIGPYQLRAVATERGAGADALPAFNPMAMRSSTTSFLPTVSLEFESRNTDNAFWRMNQILALVGTSDRCKVRLLDPEVSKLHCALLRTPRGLWLIDLLGRTGTMVNGVPIRWAPLQTGDVIALGRVVIHPTFGGPRSRSEIRPAAPRNGFGLTTGLPGRQLQPWNPPPAAPAPSVIRSTEPDYLAPIPTARPNLPAAADPSLSLLLSHFGQMQQQMLDQFQQSMMMMMQMFGGMHQDQMGLLREEIAKLGELNVEMASIKAELAARPATPPPSPQPPPQPQPGPAMNPSPNPWLAGGPYRPGVSVPPPPRPSVPRQSPPVAPPRLDPFARATPTAPEESKAPAPEAEPTDLDPGVHDWLNARLTAITHEQQTRWQKIMGLIGGGK